MLNGGVEELGERLNSLLLLEITEVVEIADGLGGRVNILTGLLRAALLKALDKRAERDEREHREQRQSGKPGLLVFPEHSERIVLSHIRYMSSILMAGE